MQHLRLPSITFDHFRRVHRIVPTFPKVSGWRFVTVFGTVSLLADFGYEGARSITGPLLASHGASGLVVGLVPASAIAGNPLTIITVPVEHSASRDRSPDSGIELLPQAQSGSTAARMAVSF
jgi:hypothetical protein